MTDDHQSHVRRDDGASQWDLALTNHIEATDATATAGYLAGRHRLDVCLQNGAEFIGVETRLHPDGVDAHIRRHLELEALGWPLVSALHPQWRQHPAELAVLLSDRVTPAHSPG